MVGIGAGGYGWAGRDLAHPPRVPEGLVSGVRVPLLVYLLGSGDDDRGMLDRSRAPEGWIQLAPYGRGTSNCYSADHAQDDLREVVAEVLAHYPVDTTRVFLAVFAGQPNLGFQWLGEGHPDVLEPANLTSLKGEIVFITHGIEDRNCPFAKTAHLAEGLKTAGARVTFLAEPGRGHDGPSARVRRDTWIGCGFWRSRTQRPAIRASSGRPSGCLAQRMSSQAATVGARSQRGTGPSEPFPAPSTISQVCMLRVSEV